MAGPVRTSVPAWYPSDAPRADLTTVGWSAPLDEPYRCVGGPPVFRFDAPSALLRDAPEGAPRAPPNAHRGATARAPRRDVPAPAPASPGAFDPGTRARDALRERAALSDVALARCRAGQRYEDAARLRRGGAAALRDAEAPPRARRARSARAASPPSRSATPGGAEANAAETNARRPAPFRPAGDIAGRRFHVFLPRRPPPGTSAGTRAKRPSRPGRDGEDAEEASALVGRVLSAARAPRRSETALDADANARVEREPTREKKSARARPGSAASSAPAAIRAVLAGGGAPVPPGTTNAALAAARRAVCFSRAREVEAETLTLPPSRATDEDGLEGVLDDRADALAAGLANDGAPPLAFGAKPPPAPPPPSGPARPSSGNTTPPGQAPRSTPRGGVTRRERPARRPRSAAAWTEAVFGREEARPNSSSGREVGSSSLALPADRASRASLAFRRARAALDASLDARLAYRARRRDAAVRLARDAVFDESFAAAATRRRASAAAFVASARLEARRGALASARAEARARGAWYRRAFDVVASRVERRGGFERLSRAERLVATGFAEALRSGRGFEAEDLRRLVDAATDAEDAEVADEDAQRLIRVLVDGLGVGRERYETWFRRAGRAKTREVMKAFDKWDPGDGAEDGVPGVGDGAGCDERERRSDERRTR